MNRNPRAAVKQACSASLPVSSNLSVKSRKKMTRAAKNTNPAKRGAEDVVRKDMTL